MEQIKMDLALDKYYLLPRNKHIAYLLIKLTAPEAGCEERPAQNLSFVIDRSGSMAGDKLEYTKKAVTFAIGHLGAEDYCSVVAFDDMVSQVAPSHRVENKDMLKQSVMSIYTGGSTNLSGGMLLGLREVKLAYKKEQVNRVLLLTDGMANVGITDHSRLTQKAREMAAGGISLSTFGLGEDFEEDLLMAMAEAGGGNFYYIQTPDQIPGIFSQELTGLLSTVAQNLTVKLKPGAGVKISGVLGYPFTAGGDGASINLPDIYSGETKNILVELIVLPHEEGAHNLLDLEVDYADVRSNLALVNLKATLSTKFSPETVTPVDNLEVIKQVELFRCAEAKEEAIRLADRGDFEGGRRVLNDQLAKISSLVQMVEDKDLAEEVKEIGANLACMARPLYSKESRKQMSYSAYNQKRGRKNR